MRQYCVYTRDPKFLEVGRWLTANDIKLELHLNRTRFWISEGKVLTEFLLKYSDTCPQIEEAQDYASL